ncbi:MAG TPA: hypothetical protein VF824_05485 [Thermoanaerobaculia bacterium]
MVKKPVETIRDAAAAPVAEPRVAETERQRKFADALAKVNAKYAGLLRRLSR